MIEATANGFFGRDFTIVEDGREVGALYMKAWRDRAEARVAGRKVTFERPSFWSRELVGYKDGVEFARARKEGPFQRGFELVHGDRRYRISRPGFFARELVVTHQNVRVGSLRPRGFGHRRVVVESPSEWPLELRVFALWVALFIWQRAAAVAAAAGGS